MSVVLGKVLEKGWKKDERNRRGPVLVVVFRNSVNGRPLFKYAPRLEDFMFWAQMWFDLFELDKKNIMESGS